MNLPLNCTVDYYDDFLNKEEALELYSELINTCKLDQSRLVIEAGGKMITTDSFKILFATERLIKGNSHPEEIHGKSFAWNGVMAKLKKKVESFLNKEFELAMCIYYPDGNYYGLGLGVQVAGEKRWNSIIRLDLHRKRIAGFKNDRLDSVSFGIGFSFF